VVRSQICVQHTVGPKVHVGSCNGSMKAMHPNRISAVSACPWTGKSGRCGFAEWSFISAEEPNFFGDKSPVQRAHRAAKQDKDESSEVALLSPQTLRFLNAAEKLGEIHEVINGIIGTIFLDVYIQFDNHRIRGCRKKAATASA